MAAVSGSGKYGIRVDTVSVVSDYNNIYVSDGAGVGYDDPTAYATLADWQAAAGNDANSKAAATTATDHPIKGILWFRFMAITPWFGDFVQGTS